VAPFAGACYLADRFWGPGSVPGFLVQIAPPLPIYAMTVALLSWNELREMKQTWKTASAATQAAS
jgi:hypothetical protein